MNNHLYKAQNLVVRDLELSDPGVAFSDIGKLVEWLTAEISKLIDRDFEGLLNILYRIDISESRAKAAFASSETARDLALLIVNRELQKVASREKYGDGENE